jgi:hypothetical protein
MTAQIYSIAVGVLIAVLGSLYAFGLMFAWRVLRRPALHWIRTGEWRR